MVENEKLTNKQLACKLKEKQEFCRKFKNGLILEGLKNCDIAIL
jgi:hypothetical protein